MNESPLTATTDHWNRHAQQWQWIASPLRPAPEDIAFIENAVADWHRRQPVPALHALLLGVTPEIARMPWPAGAQLVAIDRSQPMIEAVWPGDTAARRARLGEWTQLPLADASQHVVIGDGCFVLLSYPDAWRAAIAEARRVLREDGAFIMRFFTRPETRESLDEIIGDLTNGRIGNFHVFKWRLAMALHGALEDGVRLADIWDAWRAAATDPDALAAQLGWPREVVHTIDNYRGVATRYTFPTLAELRAALAAAFSETDCFLPRYELGDRCPTLVLRPA